MYKYVLCFALLGVLSVEAGNKSIKGVLVNTQLNKIGIAADDACYWHARRKMIRCSSGRVIKNPIQKESALTGTPGYLNGEDYIGYVVTKSSTPHLMGSGKRIDFYLRK